MIMKVFKYIKADRFFTDYLPLLRNYKHKIRGKDGNGKEIEFSAAEKKEIKAALKRLCKDLGASDL